MEGVVTAAEEAENMKNLGNEEFKKGNHLEAITYYTQSLGKFYFIYWLWIYSIHLAYMLICGIWIIDACKTEAALTNRAASYIALRK